MKNFLALMLLALVAGCGTPRLETGGAYAPPSVAADYGFFAVDSAYRIAHGTVDAAFEFERDNRAALWTVSPEIKRALDKIRPQAWDANLLYHRARMAYLTNPVPANLDLMRQVLAKMQQLSITAQAVLPKGTP